MSSSETTTDHDKIKKWAEDHGGKPAHVRDSPAVLRIEFQDKEDDLEVISWEDFFESFEENELALLHSTDSNSTFCKLVNR